ncbi:MAG: D-alanine--D-alanine ligase A, partial [Caldilineaceae bacterium]|nr:D-alanine--D-alanine ligase A [Caldilineaceae bacterium]
EVSVLGNCHSANREPNVSIPGEILPSREFYDYTAKYEDDSSQLLIPARLDEAQVAEVQEMALRAFYAVDGAGLARVDFLLDGESQ